MNFFAGYKIYDILPNNIFQITGITVYLILSLTILFNLMFNDTNIKEKAKTKKNREENSHIIKKLKNLNFKDFDNMIRIAGIILISLQQEQINNQLFANPIKSGIKWIIFSVDVMVNLFLTGIAMFLGFCLSVKFSLNSNLLFSSITFLLMGMEIAINHFQVYC
jgi:putative Ca2+/H+ antiporter (TMEM165/GDT1 family)